MWWCNPHLFVATFEATAGHDATAEDAHEDEKEEA